MSMKAGSHAKMCVNKHLEDTLIGVIAIYEGDWSAAILIVVDLKFLCTYGNWFSVGDICVEDGPNIWFQNAGHITYNSSAWDCTTLELTTFIPECRRDISVCDLSSKSTYLIDILLSKLTLLGKLPMLHISSGIEEEFIELLREDLINDIKEIRESL